jgi:hypothetical protein
MIKFQLSLESPNNYLRPPMIKFQLSLESPNNYLRPPMIKSKRTSYLTKLKALTVFPNKESRLVP